MEKLIKKCSLLKDKALLIEKVPLHKVMVSAIEVNLMMVELISDLIKELDHIKNGGENAATNK